MTSRHRPVRDWAADFDHTDPARAGDPYPIWDDLHGRCPVAHRPVAEVQAGLLWWPAEVGQEVFDHRPGAAGGLIRVPSACLAE